MPSDPGFLRFAFVFASILIPSSVRGLDGRAAFLALGTQAISKRPIMVADAVGMTRTESPDYSGPNSSIAHFSPDGKQFVIVLRKSNPENNTTDFSLFLYQ